MLWALRFHRDTGARLDYQNIVYEKREQVALITLNRPGALNSVDGQTTREMRAAWEDFRDDDGLRVAILTGAGEKAFSAGMDLVAFSSGDTTILDPSIPGSFGGFTKRQTIYKPIIAAINGFCLAGGLELALACDIRIAVPEARFGFPEVRWAIIPGAGGTQRLPRAIPQALANYLILTGEQIDAETALRAGLISHIVPREGLLDEALKIAGAICERGPLAVRLAKEAILRGADMPLEHGLAFEDLLFQRVARTDDAAEGPRAFAEKRKPVYTGH